MHIAVDTCVKQKLNILSRILAQRPGSSWDFKMALLRRDFLITNLICPFSWGRLQCKPHKVHISALIKPSFSDDSRVLQISGCYLRAVECHRRCSPPTVTLNAMIKWGWVLLSPSLKSYRWKREGGGGQKVIKFVFLLTYVDLVFWCWVEWGQQNFRCKVYFSPIVKLKLFVF